MKLKATKSELIQWYTNEKLTLKQIGVSCGVHKETVRRELIKHGIKRYNKNRGILRNPGRTKTGKKHFRWSGGSSETWSRYAKKIWKKYYKTKIPNGYLLHHCDCDCTNNRIMNLVLINSIKHSSLHRRLYIFHEKNGGYQNIMKNGGDSL